jgi:Rhs element Vgr protein
MTIESLPQSLSLTENSDLVTSEIRINGEVISAGIQIVTIKVREAINKIPSAELTIIDGSVNEGSFKLSDEGVFKPGSKIEIYLGYHSSNEMVFKGIIISNTHKVSNQFCELHVECKDERVKMTEKRAGKNYINMTDGDIVQQLLEQNNLPGVEWAGNKNVQHEQLVQSDATDWDFMISRIDVNGKICLLHNDQMVIKTPGLSESPALSLTHGASILEFHAEIDSRLQNPVVQTSAWNYSDQQVNTLESDDPEGIDERVNAASEESETIKDTITGIAAVLDKPYVMRAAPMSSEEQQAVSDSKRLKQVLVRVKGTVSYIGSVSALPGNFIQLNGIGDQFNGSVFVSAINHDYSEGNWTTEATLGWDERFFAETLNPHHPASTTGQLSSIQGLQTGIVTGIEDSAGEYRVKVRLPLVDENDEGLYARVATLDAGNNRGTFFRPEIDDEVLVGFMNDDPRHPVILGMFHSSNKAAPWEPENDNPKKGYVSRSGIKLSFDDEKKCMFIETPASRMLEMDDDAGTITVKDANGNKIVMGSDGITIESAKDLVLKAAKSISLTAPEVSLKADATMSVEGGGSTSLNSNGITEIKGSMVKIN